MVQINEPVARELLSGRLPVVIKVLQKASSGDGGKAKGRRGKKAVADADSADAPMEKDPIDLCDEQEVRGCVGVQPGYAAALHLEPARL